MEHTLFKDISKTMKWISEMSLLLFSMMNCVFVFLKMSVNAQKNDTAGLAAANAVPPAPSRWHKCPQPPGKGLNAPAEPRSSREEKNVYHLKESLVGGLELCEVWGSQETNTTPFNFIQLPQKGGEGWGEWLSQQQSKRKSTQRGGRVWTLWNISTGGPFFDGKAPFLFPLVD